MAGINPIATYEQTNFTVDTATVYKTKIDANFIAIERAVDIFAAHEMDTPAMKVVLEPGHIFTGTTLTEVGAQCNITTTNSSTSATVSDPTGIINGMVISAPGVPDNTTVTISGSTVTLSAAATASATVAATFLQVTSTIAAPAGNPRIDRLVVDRVTGVLSVITGTPGATPAVPAITAGNAPVCRILLQTSSTSITNSMITDERDLAALGRGTAGELTAGTAANNVVQLDGSAKLPAVDASQLTNLVKGSASVFGVVKVDNTTITATTGVISAATATSSTLGVVKPDGTSIVVSTGAISVPTATNSVLGLVKPDGVTVTVSGGVLSTASNIATPLAVGAYINAGLGSGYYGASLSAGTTIAGGSLVPGVVITNGSTLSVAVGSDTLTGTWKLQYGFVNGVSGSVPGLGLWQRIA